MCNIVFFLYLLYVVFIFPSCKCKYCHKKCCNQINVIKKQKTKNKKKQKKKGERLIEEMQQNTFLNALRNNPLNLLLLCVVYEDYEGKLPTSRTELYQVIARCLLRRYCAKRNWPAPEDDSVLEKMFEKEILALGELAWLCLLSDRYGFCETEMDEFERKYPGLVARELGLLYKEESLKRLKPQHEYCFLHKTFQEYVAASYIAQKLRNQKFNVFKHLNISFDDIVTKYPQVFIFVSGMLGEKATVLFTQIGEESRKFYDWNWNERCNEKIATFFIQSFDESGHAAQMAVTLCNIIPFPKVITSKLIDNYNASVDNRIQTLLNHQPIKSSLINRFQNKIIHLLRSEKLGPIYLINTTRSVCQIRIT